MEIKQTSLPGVGLRYDMTTKAGRALGVLVHVSGRHDLLVFDRDDPDNCQEVIQLSQEEAEGLGELLGASRLVGPLMELQQRVEGLAIDWLPIPASSPHANGVLGDTQARTHTGVSIVAVLRGTTAFPSPGPEFRFEPDDTAVVVGTPQGIAALGRILGN
jgi:TrkA domain protein